MRAPGTTPFDVTPEGVFDLAGNAAELVSDVFVATYYSRSPPEHNPEATGPADLPRVVRGSWFDQEPLDWKPTVPMWARAGSGRLEGFRCARTPPMAGTMPRYRALAWRAVR